ncbi:MAG: VCBS repeat-containing protein [Planctomycetota bacterium]
MNNSTLTARAAWILAAAALPSSGLAQEFGTEIGIAGPLPTMTNLAAGDVDGDGDNDLVAVGAGSSGPTIVWCENGGEAGLLPQRTLAVNAQATAPRDVEIGDLDGDGDNDIVYSGNGSVAAGWIESLGGGAFAAPQTLESGPPSGNGVEIADLDGDGRIDLVLTRGSTELVWKRNLGGGSFAVEAVLASQSGFYYDMLVVDIDGDGDADVLGANRSNDSIDLVENLGGGAFAAVRVLVSGIDRPIRMDAADLDADGDIDLGVTVPYFGYERAFELRNLGGLAFGPAVILGSSGVLDFAFADIDSDGRADAVFSDEGFPSLYWRRSAGATFGPATALSNAHRDVTDIAVADLDGDGDADVAAINRIRIEVFEQEGATFREGVAATTSTTGDDIDSADLDGDGLADLVITSDADRSRVSWHRGLGGGRFSGQVDGFDLTAASQVEIVDIDGDGDRDVIAAGGSFDAAFAGVVLWESLGDGVFADATLLYSGIADSGATFVLGDLEGDGDIDILWTHRQGFAFADQFGWIEQVAPGDFSPGPFLPNDSLGSRLELADFDMDGDSDIVTWEGSGLSPVEWAENDGAGSFGARQIIHPAGPPYIQGYDVQDLDGDGLLDVVLYGPNGVDWRRGLPGVAFAALASIEPATNVQVEVMLSDGNGDGRVDVFISSTSSLARWYENLGGGSFAASEVIQQSGGAARILALGDFDGDLDVDVLKRGGEGRLAFNPGLARFGSAICGPATANSTGDWGVVSAEGSARVTDNDVVLLAERLPASTFGYFLVASEQDLVSTVPGSQGSLCVGGAIGRLNRGAQEIFRTSADGSAAVRLDLTDVPTPTGAISLTPGDTRYVQAWHRDANPAPTSNFTNGLRLSFD